MDFLSFKTRRKRAQNDIPIFKMVIDKQSEPQRFESPFYHFQYTLGVQTPRVDLESTLIGKNWLLASSGYYVFPVDAFYISTDQQGKSRICHRKSNFNYYPVDGITAVVCAGIIPKGTYYYRNAFDDIVAESITLTHKVEPADYSNLNSLT